MRWQTNLKPHYAMPFCVELDTAMVRSTVSLHFLQGDTCCWTCDRCDPWEYVESEFKCADCGFGRWPYEDKRGCFDLEMQVRLWLIGKRFGHLFLRNLFISLPHQYMRWDSWLAIVPVCVACCGIVLTIAVIAIFIRHSETPIVKVKVSFFFF